MDEIFRYKNLAYNLRNGVVSIKKYNAYGR